MARDEILRRVRSSLRDVPRDEDAPAIPREYRQSDDGSREEVAALFAARVAEYRAIVHRVTEHGLRDAVTAACDRRVVRRLVVPADLPARWLPPQLDVIKDDALTPRDLDTADGVLTGCALAIAQTGTIVLDGGARQGRRVLTLLPDYHLCVVFEEQIVAIPPQAMSRLHGAARDGRPITFISGPSATSDIELNRVEGVHGPRNLEVLVVSP